MTDQIQRDEMVTRLCDIALSAGSVIMEVYNGDDFDVSLKSDESPVTVADQRADALISEALLATWPDIPIVTEEQASTHSLSASTFLIVDPLDGTKEFIKRGGDFTVNIALVEDGLPTLGVVYAPAKGRLFSGDVATGAFEAQVSAENVVSNQQSISVAPERSGPLSAVASLSHRTPETDAYLEKFEIGSLKSAGSSLKFCLVATGEADLYPRLGPTMEWDTAAGHAVLRAAGGEVADLATLDPLTYGKANFRNPHFVAFPPWVPVSRA
ncbi:MAG: 3'(2'),5'-bisphosphate nucleotidase CysQ [Rhodobacteraceae bacterium]|nr:3'(2'),5'-bisphosphate nucleotidase CysQ [Paracoccaceae bacterium]